MENSHLIGYELLGECNFCRKTCELRCQRCSDFYCSALCQKRDWQMHRLNCFPMPLLVSPRVLTSMNDLLSPKFNGQLDKSHENGMMEEEEVDMPHILNPPSSTVKTKQQDTTSTSMPTSSSSSTALRSKSQMLTESKSQMLAESKSQMVAKVSTTTTTLEAKPNSNDSLNLPDIDCPNDSTVILCSFRSSNRVYVRTAHPLVTALYEQQLERIDRSGRTARAINNNNNNGHFNRNDMVLAELRGNFHRMKIMEKVAKDMYRVQLIDTGMVTWVNAATFRECTEDIQKLPILIKQFQLEGAPTSKLPLSVFKNLSRFETHRYRIVYSSKQPMDSNNNNNNNMPLVTLIHTDDLSGSLNERLMRMEANTSSGGGGSGSRSSSISSGNGQTTNGGGTTSNSITNSTSPNSNGVNVEKLSEKIGKDLKIKNKNSSGNQHHHQTATSLTDELLALKAITTTTNVDGRKMDNQEKNYKGKEKKVDSSSMISSGDIESTKENIKPSMENAEKRVEKMEIKMKLNGTKINKEEEHRRCMTPPFEFKKLALNEKNVNVVVLDNSSINLGYLGCIREGDVEELVQTQFYLSSNYKNCEGNPYSPVVEEFCVAKYDNDWYRARVIANPSTDRFTVLYIDFCNEKTIGSEDIRPYPMDLKYPCYGFCCLIDGLTEMHLNDRIISYLKEKFIFQAKFTIDEVMTIVEDCALVKCSKVLADVRDLSAVMKRADTMSGGLS